MEGTTRRDFLKRISLATIGLSGIIITTDICLFIRNRKSFNLSNIISLGWPEEYNNGTRIFLSDFNIVLLKKEGRFGVISARCSHLGCIVRLADSGFICPCHGGQYDRRGYPIKGPAPLPLKWLQVQRGAKGEVQVDMNIRVKPGTFFRI
jgi:nitrite reductase/ring-hydroxylating ferredoxin subunit